jgi:hypothetical protein
MRSLPRKCSSGPLGQLLVPEVQLIARHTIAAGKVDEVLPLLPRPEQAALTEPGCLAFEVFRRLDDEHSYVLWNATPRARPWTRTGKPRISRTLSWARSFLV